MLPIHQHNQLGNTPKRIPIDWPIRERIRSNGPISAPNPVDLQNASIVVFCTCFRFFIFVRGSRTLQSTRRIHVHTCWARLTSPNISNSFPIFLFQISGSYSDQAAFFIFRQLNWLSIHIRQQNWLPIYFLLSLNIYVP